VLVTTVVVVTGNHYLLDAVAGTAVALTALQLAQGRPAYLARKVRRSGPEEALRDAQRQAA
jgi:membrane-associated phospholipid phosphatase